MEESVVNKEEYDYRLLSILVLLDMIVAEGRVDLSHHGRVRRLLVDIATLKNPGNVEQEVLNLQAFLDVLREQRYEAARYTGEHIRERFIRTLTLEGRGTITPEQARSHLEECARLMRNQR
jgi:hypothetical protein